MMAQRLRFRQVLAFSAIFLAGLVSRAEVFRCQKVFADVGEWKGQVVTALYEKGAAKEADLRTFDAVVAKVNSFTAPLLLPNPPTLIVSKNELAPRALPSENRIFLGTRLGFQEPGHDGPTARTWFRSPEYAKAVLAHEYGHLVFGVNFEKREPLVKEAYETIAQVQKETAPLGARMRANRQKRAQLEVDFEKAAIAGDKEGAGAILKQVVALDIEFKEMYKELVPYLEKIQAYREIVLQHITAYNEFFADVVAVLYAERSDAVSRALYSTHIAQFLRFHDAVKAGADLRDFNKYEAPSLGKKVLAKGQDAPYLEDHNYLEPTREFLWESYLASPTILKSRKSAVMDAVFNAIATELNYRMNHYDLKAADHHKEFNDRLIQAIRAEMSKRGIESLK